jgi:hypothetical protein
MRFPEKYILRWKDLILSNIAKLEVLTSIAGHTSSFPYDEFYGQFDVDHDEGVGEFSDWCRMKQEETGDDNYVDDYDFSAAYEYLDEVKNMDEYLPLFSNGQWLLSDFGLEPLFNIGTKMGDSSDANELLVLINKALDVTHQRSDLAEIFIQGGTATLDKISGREENTQLNQK